MQKKIVEEEAAWPGDRLTPEELKTLRKQRSRVSFINGLSYVAVFVFGFAALVLSGSVYRGESEFWVWDDCIKEYSKGESIFAVILIAITYLFFYALLYFIPYVSVRLLTVNSSSNAAQDKDVKSRVQLIAIWMAASIFLFHAEIILFVKNVFIHDGWLNFIRLLLFAFITLGFLRLLVIRETAKR